MKRGAYQCLHSRFSAPFHNQNHPVGSPLPEMRPETVRYGHHDLVRRHCDSPLDGPRAVPRFARLPSATPFGPHQRSGRHSIHIGHALGSGFVQSIFSPPPRRPPFECFPSDLRRDADLKILCSIPLTEYFLFLEGSLRGDRRMRRGRNGDRGH
jgi:hypothetical protein